MDKWLSSAIGLHSQAQKYIQRPWPYVCEVDKHRPICSPHWQHRLGKQRFRTIRTSLYVKKTLMNICECLCTRVPICKKNDSQNVSPVNRMFLLFNPGNRNYVGYLF